jgi:hypothetical protein
MGTLPGKIDAEAILRTLAEIRKSIPYKLAAPPPPEEKTRPITAPEGDALEDFEWTAVADGIEQLIAELSGAIEGARAKALDEALRIYYAAEELARDPANAHLIPHVEAMRQAFEHDYGVPIPPKKERKR